MNSPSMLAVLSSKRSLETTEKLAPLQIDKLSVTILCASGLNCIFQIAWFWPYVHRNINYDAVSYLGITRHLLNGQWRESLHGYWSPLISWLIAAFSFIVPNLVLAGHMVSVLAFLICLPLLYLFTLQLWKSPRLAALAVLWFTFAHDVAAFSAFFIGADLLFTGSVLAYFVLLLRCLRRPAVNNWILLGLAQGIAFLAKAFAMPWLTISTLIAVFAANTAHVRRRLLHSAAAMLIPLLVWTAWGTALHAKYGVFTAGYQSKWNLLDQATRSEDEHAGLSLMFDTSHSFDSYDVVDTMFPGSPAWNQHLHASTVIPTILGKLRKNVPEACKQLLVLITPGGALALAFALFVALSDASGPESKLICIAAFNVVTLIAGYSMLVFDRRYVMPLVPILIAISVPFVVPKLANGQATRIPPRFRLAAGGMLLCGLVFFQLYPASPFRTLRRDYQLSVYDTATKLKTLPSCDRLAVIGEGPFPEHGVGWEAGIYAGFFAQCRIVAFADKFPSMDRMRDLELDLGKVQPDGILVLRGKNPEMYSHLLETLQKSNPQMTAQAIYDPDEGETGKILWTSGSLSVRAMSDRVQ